MKLEKPHICSPITGICKQHSLWAYDKNRSNAIYPLIYFQKPKWINKEDFEKLIKSISIEIPKEIKIKNSIKT